MEQNSAKISVRPQTKHLKPFKKGESGNPNGRPKGQRNYETIRREAIIAIGKQNNKTPNEIEEMLVAKGVSEALKGDYRFYKDDLDRTHGTATSNVDVTTGGEKINTFDDQQIERIARRVLNGGSESADKVS